MQKTTRIAIAGLLSAAGAALNAFAAELNGGEVSTEPAPEPAAPKKRKGAAAQPEPPVEPEKGAEPAPDEDEPKGKTYEELRALIEPLVKDGKGAEVKKIIAKYGASLREIQPKDHAAFEKDIATLSY